MKIFKLPDLGEGLPDAEIYEWHVKEGDKINTDEPLVSMETAKALVEVPSPRSGTIAKLYGAPGDIIKTHSFLVEFTDGDEDQTPIKHPQAATVAGNIEVGNTILHESASGILPQVSQTRKTPVIPALRALAKRLNVDLDAVVGSGAHGKITADDIKRHAQQPSLTLTQSINGTTETIRGARKTMIKSMVEAHRTIVPTNIVDDADIYRWTDNTDFTVRILQAIVYACQSEPALNAHFDGMTFTRTLAADINIGLALDSNEGLFVPVIQQAQNMSSQQLRENINRYKTQIKDRSIPTTDFQNATISLSNFGVFAGRYASPIVIPPMVSIIGIGKMRQEPVFEAGIVKNHPMLPVSLTFDHRAATGGEASRFLGSLIEHLEKNESS